MNAEFIRAVTRPVLTFTALIFLCLMVYQSKDIPQFFIAMVGGMLAWWFGDRTIQHFKRQKNNET